MAIMKSLQLSFEFFPPASAQATQVLWSHIHSLAPLQPAFISVTYGAGGSTRERTHELVAAIKRDTALEPAAHLTCIGSTRTEIDTIARAYWDAGIRHIVALRGDKPKDQPHYVPHPQGYGYANELVEALRRIADFDISVAAYPEGHPEAASPQADLDHLKCKIEAGASRAITQYFFDTELFLRFRDRALAAGITAPLIPGILPIANIEQTLRFSQMCGATVPDWLRARFASAHTPEQMQQLGVEIAQRQCEELIAQGAEHLHFYTLNRSDMVLAICRNLSFSAA